MTYRILGGPGSPYSHKVRAVFRYRRVPHTWAVPQGRVSGSGTLGTDLDTVVRGGELRMADKRVIPVVQYPSGEYKADSTPIIHELDRLHRERGVIPPHRGIAFLAQLIEDMADEFLPIPMFYFRWIEDQQWCAQRQMAGWLGAVDDAVLEQAASTFIERQRGQLGRLAALPREMMLSAYRDFLAVMERQLRRAVFLFGSRPSLAEFGLYGQLTQYAVDPTVSTLLREEAVRTYQWTHFMDDLSGIETGEWAAPEACLTDELAALLQYTAARFIPLVQLMGTQVGMDDLRASANGMKYRVKCWLALKQQLADLPEEERNLIEPMLRATGCWDALQFADGEREKVVPIEPL